MRLSLRKAARGLPRSLSLTGNPEEAEGSAVLSPAKQLRRVKALKAAELLDGEAHRRSLHSATPDFLSSLVALASAT
jgi:hypothetical protein